LGTNLPDAVPGDGVGVVAAAAASVVVPYNTAPTTPPANIDPDMAAATTAFCNRFTCFASWLFIRSIQALRRRLVAATGRALRGS
jgi:hypothetical protein